MKISKILVSAMILASANANAADEPKNSYVQHNFVANNEKYGADIIEKDFINGWGISIRPAGAGGHFWVTAKDVSYEYVGDVQNSPDEKLRKLHTDDVKYVKLPVGGDEAFATGTVFNGSTENFVITQGDITAPAKFLFASDGGVISAWTEHKNEDGTFKRPSEAVAVIDESKDGAAFFGLAINADYSKIYAADFGAKPAIKVYDGKFKPANITFDQPFDENKNGAVDAGEYAPFNIQTLGKNIFVAYAKTQACPEEEVKAGACKAGEIFAAEEDVSKPGHGRIAEFDENGKLIAVWNDGGKLSAPWGLAIAPDNFGKLSNTLLAANFGDGTISAYDLKTREFVDYLRGADGKPVVNEGIWGLLFGNGASLGDTNALYFAAGPEDEVDGVFGSLRVAK